MSQLLRLALRRDRLMIPAWVITLGALAGLTASSYANLYATEASRRQVTETLAGTPATLALYGRIYGDSIGAITAWRLGGLAVALGAVMSILLVVRHTRAEEDSGRAELVAAGAIPRRAALSTALLVAGGASLLLGLFVALGVMAAGLPAAGSLALGAAFAGAAIVLAGVAAVAAQVADSSRTANQLALAALGGAFLIRAIGDAGPHWLSWLSPLGWTQQLRPFAGDRWWVLLPVLALAALAVAAAFRLAAHRDLGAGLLPSRPGPARGRLQRGLLSGWVAGFAVAGAAIGAVA